MKRFHKTPLVLLAAAGGLVLAAAGAALLLSGREQQRRDGRWPKKDPIPAPVVAHRSDRLIRVGESVLARRPGTGNPHYGVDLFARAGQPGALGGLWPGTTESRRARAGPEKARGPLSGGLFVDVQAKNGWIYRYLHLGSVRVEENELLRAGVCSGTVSPAGQAGRTLRAPSAF